MSTLNKKIKKLHKEFVKKNGHEPKYAEAIVEFDGEDKTHDIIKLRDYDPMNILNDIDYNNVIYYADGLNGLLHLGEEGCFSIVDIVKFSDVY